MRKKQKPAVKEIPTPAQVAEGVLAAYCNITKRRPAEVGAQLRTEDVAIDSKICECIAASLEGTWNVPLLGEKDLNPRQLNSLRNLIQLFSQTFHGDILASAKEVRERGAPH